ncbi:hypothetical protein M9H77_31134 [Catharanthus roseus]|uniref:Uncharacterized protein n=1 Tax=Catharanthus roseus TaxID=4058 RepID=A0ACC0A0I1_CATRO|nr:hypothetical protein M9H77_31134 [Catharanthus roseus]
MGLKPIKTWSLLKQVLRIRCGVENHEGQGQGHSEVKLMEPSMVEEMLIHMLRKKHLMRMLIRIEDKGRSLEKELYICLEDLPMSPSFKPSLSFNEVYFKELKKEYSTWIQKVLRLAWGCLRMKSIQVLLKAKDPCEGRKCFPILCSDKIDIVGSNYSWIIFKTLARKVFKTFKSNMEDELHHVQQTMEGLEQQLS